MFYTDQCYNTNHLVKDVENKVGCSGLFLHDSGVCQYKNILKPYVK